MNKITTKKIKIAFNVLAFLLVSLLLAQRAPTIFSNFSNQGQELTPKEVPVIGDLERSTVIFPNGTAVALFWATWCGPCKIEMDRLKTSVLGQKIPPHQIYAINPFEDRLTVQKFLDKNDYPFIFIDYPELTDKLGINLTPTTLHIKDNRIRTISSGMSLIGIWKAESLFK